MDDEALKLQYDQARLRQFAVRRCLDLMQLIVHNGGNTDRGKALVEFLGNLVKELLK